MQRPYISWEIYSIIGNNLVGTLHTTSLPNCFGVPVMSVRRERRSPRLKTWNYASNAAYFVTICTHDRYPFFGQIQSQKMQHSDIGEIAYQYWINIPKNITHVLLDKFIIMPNHVHGILIIDRPKHSWDNNHGRDVACNVPTNIGFSNTMSDLAPKAGSISAIVRSYKAAVTKFCRQNGHLEFAWQPRYYDHIIRDKESFQRIQNYIVNNPLNWTEDKLNPDNL